MNGLDRIPELRVMSSAEVSAFWRTQIDRRARSAEPAERRAAAESEAILQQIEDAEAALDDLLATAEAIVARTGGVR